MRDYNTGPVPECFHGMNFIADDFHTKAIAHRVVQI